MMLLVLLLVILGQIEGCGGIEFGTQKLVIDFENIPVKDSGKPRLRPDFGIHGGLLWPGFHPTRTSGRLQAPQPGVIIGSRRVLTYNKPEARQVDKSDGASNSSNVHSTINSGLTTHDKEQEIPPTDFSNAQNTTSARLAKRSGTPPNDDDPDANTTIGSYYGKESTFNNTTISHSNPYFTCLHNLNEHGMDPSKARHSHHIAFFDLLSLSLGCSANADKIVPISCDVRVSGFAGAMTRMSVNASKAPVNHDNDLQMRVIGGQYIQGSATPLVNGTWKFRPLAMTLHGRDAKMTGRMGKRQAQRNSAPERRRPRQQGIMNETRQESLGKLESGEEKEEEKEQEVEGVRRLRTDVDERSSESSAMPFQAMEVVPRHIFPVGNTAWTGLQTVSFEVLGEPFEKSNAVRVDNRDGRTSMKVDKRGEIVEYGVGESEAPAEKNLFPAGQHGASDRESSMDSKPPYVYLNHVKIRAYMVVGWRYGLGDVRRLGEERLQ